LRSVN
jgi:hypothetical protein